MPSRQRHNHEGQVVGMAREGNRIAPVVRNKGATMPERQKDSGPQGDGSSSTRHATCADFSDSL